MKLILALLLPTFVLTGLPAPAGVVITNLHSFAVSAQGANPASALVRGNDGNFYGTTSDGGTGGGKGTVFRITAKGALTTLHSFTGLSDGAAPNGLVMARDGSFYGTTANGGSNGDGTVFRVNSKGFLTTVYTFSGYPNDGSTPMAGLMLGQDGNFYGTTYYGGTNDSGTIFEVTPNGTLTLLYHFAGTNDGRNPQAALVEDRNGNLFGMAHYGGDFGLGTIFKLDLANQLQTLYSFAGQSDGALPQAPLTRGSDGNFYGTTPGGGPNGSGIVFVITPDGTFTSLYTFDGAYGGGYPQSGLAQGSDGNFYGTTYYGGTNYSGTVFKITPDGEFTRLYSFTGTNDGGNPQAGLVLGGDGNFYGSAYDGGASFGGTIFKITPAGKLTSLYSFPVDNDGTFPAGALVKGPDGAFYGTASSGGQNDSGTVYKITTNGVLTSLYSFNGNDGVDPTGALSLGLDGNFYGETSYGGSNSSGTVFKITTNGVLTSLYSFTNGTDGAQPQGGLALGLDGFFYGEAASGGADADGTIFKITTDGVLTSLYSFTNGMDGRTPQDGLLLVPDGSFYGATLSGVFSDSIGAYDAGTLFHFTTTGTFTVLYSFTNGSDGSAPNGLVWGGDGTLYGTAYQGGQYDNGTVFQITTNGAITILHSFNGDEGAEPAPSLLQGSDGNFYGTTYYGGKDGNGAVFQMTPTGSLTNLYSFMTGADGAYPQAGLAQAADGSLYGTTGAGGSADAGTVFRISAAPALTGPMPGRSNELAGARLSLNVAANGLPMLSYQWEKNGVGLRDGGTVAGSATSNLTINPLAVGDSGTYQLVVANFYGVASSTTLVLTVAKDNIPPVVVIKSPAAGARTASSIITGTASDNVTVTNVTISVTNFNNGTQSMSGTATLQPGGNTRDWSFDLSGVRPFAPGIPLPPLPIGPALSAAAVAPPFSYAGTNIIAVQGTDASGNTSAIVKRTLFVKVPQTLYVTTLGNGVGTLSGRASVTGDPVPANGVALNIGEGYSITALPAPHCLFAGWGGTFLPVGPATNATLSFVMEANTVLTATFVTNPFVTLATAYNGLFDIAPSNAAVETSGLIANLTVNTNGVYSGKLLIAGTNFTLTGRFSPINGLATNFVPPLAAAGGALEVDLALHLFDAPPRRITGAVIGTNAVMIDGTNSDGWTASDLTLYATSTNSRMDAGEFNLIFTNTTPNEATNTVSNEIFTPLPGSSYALLTNHAGIVTLTGSLADATVLAQTLPIGEDNGIPVYTSLYNGTGMLFGRLELGASGAVPSGMLTWIRESYYLANLPGGAIPQVISPPYAGASATGKESVAVGTIPPGIPTPYAGFTNFTAVQGSVWTNTSKLATIIQPNSQLVFSGSGPNDPLTTSISVGSGNTLVRTGGATNFISGSVDPRTGALKVTFVNTTGNKVTGTGVVLQNSGTGGGFFQDGSSFGVGSFGAIKLQPPSQ